MTTIEPSDTAQGLACACTRVRRLDRALTHLYDDALAPSGLHVTQYALLSKLATLGRVALTRMADELAVERTTLTRNLAPLQRDGLVLVEHGSDRRTRFVKLTDDGRAALERARPLWRLAQERVAAGLGHDRFDALLDELADVEARIR